MLLWPAYVELSFDQVLLQRQWRCLYQRGNEHWENKAEVIKGTNSSFSLRNLNVLFLVDYRVSLVVMIP